jgi:NAD(P)-dependent dehydrogenase (short-subunit alcohol dehydrogenase family)
MTDESTSQIAGQISGQTPDLAIGPRRILITGSSSGIGAALARRLAGPGVSILIHARRNRLGADRVAADVTARGARVVTAYGDLGEAGVPGRLVEEAVAAFGGLDAVVANAGWADRADLLASSDESLAAAQAGISGAFVALVRAALPHLEVARGGRIVAVSAFGAHVFRPGVMTFPVTAAAKAALETHARSLAFELADRGITVNAVAPGFIEKEAGTSSALTEENRNAIASAIPMRRLGTADEVAAVIGFLLSREAGYVTGQVIHVAGGLVI